MPQILSDCQFVVLSWLSFHKQLFMYLKSTSLRANVYAGIKIIHINIKQKKNTLNTL